MTTCSTDSDTAHQWELMPKSWEKQEINKNQYVKGNEISAPYNGRPIYFGSTCNHNSGYLSSDEEADIIADVTSLAYQLFDLNLMQKDQNTVDEEIDSEIDQDMEKWINLVQTQDLQTMSDTHFPFMDAREDIEAGELASFPMERGDFPSGLTSSGPVKNMDANPRDQCCKVTYGRMERVHELNISDGIDECCEKPMPEAKYKLNSKKRGDVLGIARRAGRHLHTKSLTLPHNMAKWTSTRTQTASGCLRSSATTVMSKGRSFFRTTSRFFLPLVRRHGESIRRGNNNTTAI